MLVLGHALLTMGRIARFLIEMYTFVVGAAVLLSWVRPDPRHPLVRLIFQMTLPVFRWARRLIPRRFLNGPFDPTLILVLILLLVIDSFVVGLLMSYAYQMINAASH